jgi:hypothetical protein
MVDFLLFILAIIVSIIALPILVYVVVKFAATAYWKAWHKQNIDRYKHTTNHEPNKTSQ